MKAKSEIISSIKKCVREQDQEEIVLINERSL